LIRQTKRGSHEPVIAILFTVAGLVCIAALFLAIVEHQLPYRLFPDDEFANLVIFILGVAFAVEKVVKK